jgi:hypothetical protein
MRPLHFAASACLFAFLMACGDDEPADPGDGERDASAGDSGRKDASADGARDAGRDAGGSSDAAADAGPSADTGTPTAGNEECVGSTTPICIAASGKIDGTPFTCKTTTEGVAKVLIGTPSWVMNCDTEDVLITLSIPTQSAGPIDVSVQANDNMELQFSANDMGELADNLVRGTLDAEYTAQGRLKGTFQASWSKPTAQCDPGDPFADACAEGELSMSFDVAAPP